MSDAFNAALESYKNAMVQDYVRWNDAMTGENPYRAERIKEYVDGIQFKFGRSYIKVICEAAGGSKRVHSFIVLKRGKFNEGDILKAATWAAPATNKARGNVFGEYHITWTGAEYLS